MKFVSVVVFFIFSLSSVQAGERWYNKELVSLGEKTFRTHCSSCHGVQAQGLHKNWQEPLEDGNYPPPPLNGTAHAWHHPISVLAQYIFNGGKKYGGVMPGFKGILSQKDAVSTIAYFQNFWNDDLYMKWLENNGLDVRVNFNKKNKSTK